MNTKEQVHTALEQYLEAHTKASDAAAAVIELKGVVGGNETDRKAARARIPADEYEAYTLHLAEAEHIKVQATAAAERAEKVLNTLREVMESETADVNRATAEIAARTADKYASIGMTPPARPIVVKFAPLSDEEVPF